MDLKMASSKRTSGGKKFPTIFFSD